MPEGLLSIMPYAIITVEKWLCKYYARQVLIMLNLA